MDELDDRNPSGTTRAKRKYDMLGLSQKNKKLKLFHEKVSNLMDDMLPIDDISGRRALLSHSLENFPLSVDASIDDGADSDDEQYIKMKRKCTYTRDQVELILDHFEGYTDRLLIQDRINALIKRIPFYNHVSVKKILSWRKSLQRPTRTMGAPIDHDFESEVWARLIICAIEKSTDPLIPDKVKVLYNVAYSGDSIRAAALSCQKLEKYAGNVTVQRLKFSNRWVKNFLQRRNFSRRRITRVLKNVPTENQIRVIMKTYQDAILNGEFELTAILNLDETAYEILLRVSLKLGTTQFDKLCTLI